MTPTMPDLLLYRLFSGTCVLCADTISRFHLFFYFSIGSLTTCNTKNAARKSNKTQLTFYEKTITNTTLPGDEFGVICPTNLR